MKRIVLTFVGVVVACVACGGAPRETDAMESTGVAFEAVTPTAASDVGDIYERALSARAEGDFESPLEELESAYATAPNTKTAILLGELLSITGSMERSRKVIDTALEADPGATELLFARAQHQLRERLDIQAEATLRSVVGIDGRHDRAQRLLGGLLLRIGDPDEAAHFLAAADRNRDDRVTRQTLAEAYARTPSARIALLTAELELTVGDYAAAQHWLDQSRGDGSVRERWAAAQAWTWYAAGEIARGDAVLRGIGAGRGYVELARAARAVRNGETFEARRQLVEAIRTGPRERSFLRRVADLYMVIGAPDEAQRLLARAASAALP